MFTCTFPVFGGINMKLLKRGRLPDLTIFVLVLLLLVIGMLMVYSSSHVWAEYKYGDPYYFLKRQLLFAALGIVAMAMFVSIPIYAIRKHVHTIFFACIVLLILVLIPGIGLIRGGAQSWIGIGAFSIQPSEFMKLGLIIFLANMLSTGQKYITSFKKGFFPSLLLVFTAFGLIMLQPDLGTGMVLVLTCAIMMFVAGARISHFTGLAVLGILGLIGLIASAPYRIDRITAFLNPWEDPL